MSLKIVGAALGRTGTNSLKLALERLGFGPCHHMYEVRDHPEQLPYWQAAARGELPDWDEVFADYRSCVDWPSARFWPEIAAHYPDAKVLLTLRDAESWFASVHATIYPSIEAWPAREPGHHRDMLEMAAEIIVQQSFGGRLDDRDHALAVYRAHEEEVRRTIAPERLLAYDVSEGWEPLCAFLEVPVPDVAFPRTNTSEEFRKKRPQIFEK
ncbi:MAG: sulfotransferase family protein [Alphaproteobacteria bacterium]